MIIECGFCRSCFQRKAQRQSPRGQSSGKLLSAQTGSDKCPHSQSVMQIAECGIKADDIIFSGVPRWDNLIKAGWPKLAGKELGPRGNLLGS